jgi:hypothetical protein
MRGQGSGFRVQVYPRYDEKMRIARVLFLKTKPIGNLKCHIDTPLPKGKRILKTAKPL